MEKDQILTDIRSLVSRTKPMIPALGWLSLRQYCESHGIVHYSEDGTNLTNALKGDPLIECGDRRQFGGLCVRQVREEPYPIEIYLSDHKYLLATCQCLIANDHVTALSISKVANVSESCSLGNIDMLKRDALLECTDDGQITLKFDPKTQLFWLWTGRKIPNGRLITMQGEIEALSANPLPPDPLLAIEALDGSISNMERTLDYLRATVAQIETSLTSAKALRKSLAAK